MTRTAFLPSTSLFPVPKFKFSHPPPSCCNLKSSASSSHIFPDSSHSPPPNLPPPPLPLPTNPSPKNDRKVLETLTSSAHSTLRDLGDEAKQNLSSISSKNAQYADMLIQEETDALLTRYDESQKEILANVERDREVIEAEMEKIEQLVARRSKSWDGMSKKGVLFGVNCVAFLTGGVGRMFGGGGEGEVGMGLGLIGAGLLFMGLFWEERKKRDEEEGKEGSSGVQ